MISLKEAKKIVTTHVPGCIIEKTIRFKNKYVIVAPTSDSLEGNMDPYYYVDINTGKFGSFPIYLPDNIEVFKLL